MLKALSLLAASELGGAVSRNVRAVPYLVLGALMLLFGMGFLLDLSHTWLMLRMGPMAASGVLAAVLLTVSGGLILTACAIRAKPPATSSRLATSALLAAPIAARFLGSRLRFGTVAVAGVVAAGALLGRFLGRH